MTHPFAIFLAAPAALGLSVAAHAQESLPNDAVNSQVTDSVSQVNTDVLGEAPAASMGNLSSAESKSEEAVAAHDATSAQQNSGTVLQATSTQGVQLLTGVGSKAEAGETEPDR